MSTSAAGQPGDFTGTSSSVRLEGAAPWRRSSYCTATGCVEVATDATVIKVRNSKLNDGPILAFDLQEWSAFIDAVKAGEFDLDRQMR